LKAVVNECLRLALSTRARRVALAPFVVHARDLGELRPGLGLDNIGDLLDVAEGPTHR
jgi:hypothetical protein